MWQKKLLFELTKAITNLDEKMATEVIKTGVDLDATVIYSKTPLSYSLEMDAENIAILLIDGGANPEKTAICETSHHLLRPIHFASKLNQTKFLSALLKKDVDVEVQSGAGLCAMHYAAYEGHIHICSALIKYGADVNSCDSYKRTPLHRAAENGQIAVIELLLRSGAKVCVTDIVGNTPLHLACYFNQTLAAKALLDFHSDVNCHDKNGNTPLHVICNPDLQLDVFLVNSTFRNCAFQRRIFYQPDQVHVYQVETKLVDILILYGADLEAVNNTGMTPIEYAKNSWNPESYLSLLEIFVNAGLWITDFSLSASVSPKSAPHMRDSKEQYEHKLICLQCKQLALKQQCKRTIRKNIQLNGSQGIHYFINCLPLPQPLRNFLL